MRFAVYYSPPQMSLLHRLGASWLGYDAFDGNPLEQPGNGLLAGKTEQPGHYGLHATLKAPFHLKPGATSKDLQAGVMAIARNTSTVVIPRLVLSSADGFLALVPDLQHDDLTELAAVCVRKLDHLRKEMDAAERNRRQSGNLTPKHRAYLDQWGYPYVFDAFRFHITLTRKLDADEMVAVTALAREHFAEVLDQPLHISALTTFIESEPGKHFRVADVFPLTASIMAAYA